MYMIISRENPERHPILKIVINFLGNENCQFSPPKLTLKTGGNRIITFDPLSALLILPRIDYFFCLEMYEHQVENTSIRNRCRNLIYRIGLNIALKKANIVIFPNELRRNYYMSKYRLKKNNTKILKNFPSKNTIQLISQLGKAQRSFFALYAGTINAENRGLDTFLELAKRHPQEKFGICGRASRTSCLDQLPRNVEYLGDLSEADYFATLQKSINGFLFYSNENLNTRFSASVKLYEYLLAGCNIIANRNEGILSDKTLVSSWVDECGDLVSNEDYNTTHVAQQKDQYYEMRLGELFV